MSDAYINYVNNQRTISNAAAAQSAAEQASRDVFVDPNLTQKNAAVGTAADLTSVTPTSNPAKRIYLTIGGKPWDKAMDPTNIYFAENLILTLDQEVTISASSEYENVLKEMTDKFKNSTAGKAMNLIQNVSNGLQAVKDVAPTSANAALSKLQVLPPNSRYQTTLSNMPAWKETSNLQIQDFTFKFFLGMSNAWKGRTEVYNPVIALSRINLPTPAGSGRLQGPLPSVAYVYDSIALSMATSVGSAARSAFSGSNPDLNFEKLMDGIMHNYESKLQGILSNYPTSCIMNVSIGQHLVLPPFTVKTTKYKFSIETDDEGYPIWGEVTWSGIETIEVANSGMSAYKLRT